jgi:hypothetical protein
LGYAGDGGAATAAKLYKPSGLYVDGTGSVFVADYYNHRIRKIDGTTGIISTIAGNGTLGFDGDGGSCMGAKLNTPSGITRDAAGNWYIGDKTNNRIRKIDAAGIITTIGGKDTVGYSGDGGAATLAKLKQPTSVQVDAANNVYFVDYGNNRIRKISPAGVITNYAGAGIGSTGDGGPATAATFSFMSDIALDAAGNMYVADPGNHKVRKITVAGAGFNSPIAQNTTLALYPNPTSGSFTMELPKASDQVVVTIEDITGRLVETRNIMARGTKIEYAMTNAAPGFYLVKAYADGAVYYGKMEVK